MRHSLFYAVPVVKRASSGSLCSVRALILTLAVYALCLLLLIPHLSLWLDELLNIIGSTKLTLASLIAFVPQNSGGAPLGYLVQRLSFQLFGVSEFSARLPSVLSSLAAAAGMFALARRLQIRRPLAAVLLFCLLPMQWRYAMEGRPYAMALALSIWAGFFFLQQRMVPYTLAIAAGLYTNPYSFFIPAAHLLWLVFKAPRRLTHTLLAATCAALLFLPWYLYARRAWAASVPANGHISPLKEAELITRELVGAGYIGTGLVLLLAYLGWKRCRAENPARASFLAAGFLVPFPLVLAGDAFFHYFLAARQFLFVLPPLCLLAAFAIHAENNNPLRNTADPLAL